MPPPHSMPVPAEIFWMLRPDDFLYVGIKLVGFEYLLDTQQLSAGNKATISLFFPAQHITERAHNIVGTNPSRPSFSGPWEAAASRASRVDFNVAAGVSVYTLDELLRKCAAGALVVKEVNEASTPDLRKEWFEPVGGVFPRTALEVPWGIVLQPKQLANAAGPAFTLPPTKRIGREGTLAWQMRLTPTWGVAAVLALDSEPFALTTPAAIPLESKERERIVNGFDAVHFDARAVRDLSLGATGASFSIEAQLGTLLWTHRTTTGRDQFVKLVEEGFLYPTGIKASHVTEINRVVSENDGKPYAYLEKQYYVEIRDPVKEERANTDFRFRRIDLTRFPKRTPPLNPPSYAGELIKGDTSTDTFARRIRVREVNYRFPMDVHDAENRGPTETAAVQFFVSTKGTTNTELMKAVSDAYKALRPNVRALSFGGERLALVCASNPNEKTTSLPVLQVVLDAPTASDFRAEVKRALANVPELDLLREAGAQGRRLADVADTFWKGTAAQLQSVAEQMRLVMLILPIHLPLRTQIDTWMRTLTTWATGLEVATVQQIRDQAKDLFDRATQLGADVDAANIPANVRAQVDAIRRQWKAAQPPDAGAVLQAEMDRIKGSVAPVLDATRQQVEATRALLTVTDIWKGPLDRVNELVTRVQASLPALAQNAIRARDWIQKQKDSAERSLGQIKDKLPEVPTWSTSLTVQRVLKIIEDARVPELVDAGAQLVQLARQSVEHEAFAVLNQAMQLGGADVVDAARRVEAELREVVAVARERSAALERAVTTALGGHGGAAYLEMIQAAAGGNPHGVWAQLVSSLENTAQAQAIDAALHAAKAGAMMLPEFSFTGLSKALGPVSGDLASVIAGNFDAAKIFRQLPILGGLNIVDLFDNAAKPPFPGFTTKRDGNGVILSFDCGWDTRHLKEKLPLGIITVHRPKKMELHLQVRVGLTGPGSPTARAKLDGLALSFLNLLRVEFDSLEAISDERGFRLVPKFNPATGIRLLGDLDFVQQLADMAAKFLGGVGPRIQALESSIRASMDVAVPDIGGAAFAILNARFSTAVELPFESRPARVSLSFGTRERPFSVAVSLLGGGGFFSISVESGGAPPDLAFGIEFGGIFNFSVVVAKGSLYALGGIYAEYRGGKASVTAYLRFGGTIDVLGIVSASINALLSLTYAGGSLTGRVEVSVDIHILFFSFHASFELERTVALGGAKATPLKALSDATLAHVLAQESAALDDYWAAFAE